MTKKIHDANLLLVSTDCICETCNTRIEQLTLENAMLESDLHVYMYELERLLKKYNKEEFTKANQLFLFM